jgi:hypothetical protein
MTGVCPYGRRNRLPHLGSNLLLCFVAQAVPPAIQSHTHADRRYEENK